ncbi:DUF6284 family protein [Streptomyces sp. NPDC001941]|uniref:DUF6284 family protein n=1 Tax=Streptomyces sp. NPDC001941 TaxID=3154659 RepID=UPI00332C7BDC
MRIIVARQSTVTAPDVEREPTDAELDALVLEEPLIAAGLELLDAEIAVLDRMLSELDQRRLRRARRRVLAARRALANQTATTAELGA